MQARGFWTLGNVGDDELELRLRRLLQTHGCTEARIVAHLAEVDARRLHLRGAPSLFQYCLVELGFSESEAWYRICAARTGRRFPVVFELLENRELHLTAIALLSKHLTDENHRELLAEARGKTKQQILESLACRWPKVALASQVRRIPAGAVALGPTGTLEPRSAESYCLQLSVSHELKAKLELARDLMSHANPTGDLAVVVERALDVLIQRLKARRFGQTGRVHAVPAPEMEATKANATETAAIETAAIETVAIETVATETAATETAAIETAAIETAATETAATETRITASRSHEPESNRKRRHVRQQVRRDVVERDGDGCSHVGPDGRRCGAGMFLELHHEHPFALGGPDSSHNLRWLCRAHNRFASERELGAARVAQAISRNSRR